jgi:hypothetical protein
VTGEHQGGQARRSGSLGTTQDPDPGTDNERDRFYVLISTAYANGRRATLPETRGKAACSEVSWKHRDHQKRQSDIKPEYWVAVGADVSIPPLLWPASRRSISDDPLRASRDETARQAAKDAAQPMLWVDTRGVDGPNQALALLLGNSRPSIARNVKVSFDPTPPSTLDIKVVEILKQGIGSLPPGRTMKWALVAVQTRATGTRTRRTRYGSQQDGHSAQ